MAEAALTAVIWAAVTSRLSLITSVSGRVDTMAWQMGHTRRVVCQSCRRFYALLLFELAVSAAALEVVEVCPSYGGEPHGFRSDLVVGLNHPKLKHHSHH